MEELRRIFTEDSDSEHEAFEGFSSHDLEVSGNKHMEVCATFT